MELKTLTLILVFMFACGCSYGAESLRNTDFENGLDGWKKYNKDVPIETVEIDGSKAAMFCVREDVKPDWYHLSQNIKAEPGAVYEAKSEITGKGISNGYSVANFCRLTESGDVVVKCKSTNPSYVKKLCIMTKKTLRGDGVCGEFFESPKNNKFKTPPMSFGYAFVK